MEEAFHRSFGYLIAFILPGAVALYSLHGFFPDLLVVQSVAASGELSLSAWIVVLLGSLGTGLIVSAVRWLIVDALHHHTGLMPPKLNYRHWNEQLEAFLVAVEHSYRYYQFYALCGVPHNAYYADLPVMRRSRVWRGQSLQPPT